MTSSGIFATVRGYVAGTRGKSREPRLGCVAICQISSPPKMLLAYTTRCGFDLNAVHPDSTRYRRSSTTISGDSPLSVSAHALRACGRVYQTRIYTRGCVLPAVARSLHPRDCICSHLLLRLEDRPSFERPRPNRDELWNGGVCGSARGAASLDGVWRDRRRTPSVGKYQQIYFASDLPDAHPCLDTAVDGVLSAKSVGDRAPSWLIRDVGKG